MKNVAILALLAAMTAFGAIVVACGGSTPPAATPDGVPSASAPSTPDTSAVPSASAPK